MTKLGTGELFPNILRGVLRFDAPFTFSRKRRRRSHLLAIENISVGTFCSTLRYWSGAWLRERLAGCTLNKFVGSVIVGAARTTYDHPGTSNTTEEVSIQDHGKV